MYFGLYFCGCGLLGVVSALFGCWENIRKDKVLRFSPEQTEETWWICPLTGFTKNWFAMESFACSCFLPKYGGIFSTIFWNVSYKNKI